MQAWTCAASCLPSQSVSCEKPEAVLGKTLWRSLPPSRTRQALNFSFEMSSPRGGRVMAVLLVMATPGQPCACGLCSDESGHEILSGLYGARFVGDAGGLISPTGFVAGCRAQPHRRLMCGRKLVASARLSQHTMPGVRRSNTWQHLKGERHM